MKKIKLVATDLDGTFLKNDKSISEKNRLALELLGENRIIRVAATGRNLNKVREVIPPEAPFDFIIFSSGAGIFDWQNNKHIFEQNISSETSGSLAGYLIKKDLNFNAFWAVPDNHHLWFHRGSRHCEEYERYFSFHNSYAFPLPDSSNFYKKLCQFLVILPNNPVLFESLKSEIEELFDEIGVIRSTSPLGTGFIRMELFHKSISKGNALSFICDKTGVSRDETLGIGNDYNDLDLLKFTNYSFLVANSPEELKLQFLTSPSNDEDAFSFVVNQFFKQ
jgi:Cof subfamily protein (haloacid dehalogenase superfamily)